MRTAGALAHAAAILSTFCAAQSGLVAPNKNPASITAGQQHAIQYLQGEKNEAVTAAPRMGDTVAAHIIATLTTNWSSLWAVSDSLDVYTVEEDTTPDASKDFASSNSASTATAASASLISDTPQIDTHQVAVQEEPLADSASLGTARANQEAYPSAISASSGAGATSNTKDTGSAKTNAAAVRAVSAISGASPLALVFCVFAGMIL